MKLAVLRFPTAVVPHWPLVWSGLPLSFGVAAALVAVTGLPEHRLQAWAFCGLCALPILITAVRARVIVETDRLVVVRAFRPPVVVERGAITSIDDVMIYFGRARNHAVSVRTAETAVDLIPTMGSEFRVARLANDLERWVETGSFEQRAG